MKLITRPEIIRAGVDEVEEAGPAVELGEKESGLGLGLRGFDPLQTRPYRALFATPLPENSAPIAATSHYIGFVPLWV